MTRFVSVCVAITGVLAAAALIDPPLAHAESGMLPNGAQIRFNRMFITEDGVRGEPSTPEAVRNYLNLAHCVCSQSMAGDETEITYELGLSITTGTSRPAEVWVGTQCEDDLVRNTMCRRLDGKQIPDIDVLAIRPENLSVPLYDAINGIDNMSACQQREGDAFVWLLVDSDGDNVYDYFTNQSIGKGTDVPGIDTQPPPLPTDFEASSAERAVRLSWTPPLSRASDVFFYQALCADQDGNPALSSPPAPRYQTARSVCNLEQDITLEPSEIETDDDTMAIVPDAMRRLDPAYLCGDSTSPTATGLLIEGLDNNVPYTVTLVAIDRSGNASGTYFTRTITPRPATDFWEDLHDRGSLVEGGFCLLAETYGDGNPLTQALRAFRDGTLASTVLGRALIEAYYATTGTLGEAVHGSIVLRVIAAIVLAPLVVIALAWHALTLPGLIALVALGWLWVRRRRWLTRTVVRLARFAVPAAAVALALVPAQARAQGPTPYWDNTDGARRGGAGALARRAPRSAPTSLPSTSSSGWSPVRTPTCSAATRSCR